MFLNLNLHSPNKLQSLHNSITVLSVGEAHFPKSLVVVSAQCYFLAPFASLLPRCPLIGAQVATAPTRIATETSLQPTLHVSLHWFRARVWSLQRKHTAKCEPLQAPFALLPLPSPCLKAVLSFQQDNLSTSLSLHTIRLPRFPASAVRVRGSQIHFPVRRKLLSQNAASRYFLLTGMDHREDTHPCYLADDLEEGSHAIG